MATRDNLPRPNCNNDGKADNKWQGFINIDKRVLKFRQATRDPPWQGLIKIPCTYWKVKRKLKDGLLHVRRLLFIVYLIAEWWFLERVNTGTKNSSAIQRTVMADKECILRGDATAEEAADTEEHEKPEGGWGWVVCCGTFTVNFIVFGIHNSFGVVYEYLVDKQNLGKAETGWSKYWQFTIVGIGGNIGNLKLPWVRTMQFGFLK